MAQGSNYGFKLSGIQIPENTTELNFAMSDGTSTSEYNLTGNITDGFSGTGISAACTADDDVYDIDITVTALTSEDTGDEYTINLSLPEEPTQSFKDALTVTGINAKIYQVPIEYEELTDTPYIPVKAKDLLKLTTEGMVFAQDKDDSGTYSELYIITRASYDSGLPDHNYVFVINNNSDFHYGASDGDDYPQYYE